MNNWIFTPNDLTELLVIAGCLCLSSFFSAAETAITSLGALKVRHLMDSQGHAMRHLKIWLTKPHHILTTILIYNNVFNILIAAIATSLAIEHLKSNAIGIATGVTTFLVLVFGEIVPKSYGKAHHEKFAIFALHVVRVAYYLIFPLVWVLSEFARKVVTYMTGEKERDPVITEEEIEFLINVGENDGVIEDTKREIISSVFEFGETVVREVMTPRTAIAALNEQTSTIKDAIAMVNESGHSRIPVYKENLDNITGVILAKDLLKFANEPETSTKLSELVREPFFTPESKPIMEVFKELKTSKVHLAVVVDEYGGTAGIVTMEDIIEEIVGEIHDEHDIEEAHIAEVNKGAYEVSGAVNIQEFVDYFNLADTVNEDEKEKLEAEVDTVGGWITEIVGELPEVGQKVKFGHLNIEVTEVDQRRIEKLLVEREEPAPSALET